MPDRADAKKALDEVIKKSRIQMYKPIQIAEILYRDRVFNDIDLSNLESYRSKSKIWRDDMSKALNGRGSTSSSKYQDNLFEENAITPALVAILGLENRRTDGAVEAYIYRAFVKKHGQLSEALKYCIESTKEDFDVQILIKSFWKQAGLKRSLDKIYEIIVYALFSTLVEAIGLQMTISIDKSGFPLLKEFGDFSKKIMGLDILNSSRVQEGKIYRVGITNAADRGLDMYSNWGPAIQIKHLCLDEKLAEDIVSNVSSDRVVIVCKDVEKGVILSLLTQIGWKSHIQSIVTESELIGWYEKALRGQYADLLGSKLIGKLCEEINTEFPAVFDLPQALTERNYQATKEDAFWK